MYGQGYLSSKILNNFFFWSLSAMENDVFSVRHTDINLFEFR
jgi:hypothetical protein